MNEWDNSLSANGIYWLKRFKAIMHEREVKFCIEPRYHVEMERSGGIVSICLEDEVHEQLKLESRELYILFDLEQRIGETENGLRRAQSEWNEGWICDAHNRKCCVECRG